MSQKLNIIEERKKLLSDLFDLYALADDNYISNKEALRILTLMGRTIELEEENEFLSIIDPNNKGRITKENFLGGVEEMFTIPDDFLPEITDAFKVFDKNKDGEITCKDLKNLLINLSGEYNEKEVDDLFKILGLDINGKIVIKDFINAWKCQ